VRLKACKKILRWPSSFLFTFALLSLSAGYSLGSARAAQRTPRVTSSSSLHFLISALLYLTG
jgi:hypothetical protein